jgi:hypothetical protein
MTQFHSLLKKINAQLDLPQPEKARIMMEIASDIEDLYDIYISKNVTEAEAIRLVQEKFDMDEQALHELISIHDSVFRKWMDRLSSQAQTRLEKIMLISVCMMVIVFGSQAVFQNPFFIQSSPFSRPIMVLCCCGLVQSAAIAYRLFIRKNHKRETLRSGLRPLFIMTCTAPLMGILGYFIELYQFGPYGVILGSKLLFVFKTNNAEFSRLLYLMTEWMLKSASMMMMCLFVTLVLATFLYILNNKVIAVEQAETACLFE